MKKIKGPGSILLPALRAQMGDWIYYVSSMRMTDIAVRVSYAEEIHKSKKLNELLQRQISDRKKYIVNYLETQDQRFFNSIIVGVYKGRPEWFELAVGSNENFNADELPDDTKGVIGFLKLSGHERLFAIDGQHRVAAIRDVIKKVNKIEGEQVPTIFVSAKMDDAGKKRTRRLFSTLNRYSKQVKQSYIYALDEDDTVAIALRKLIDEHTFFLKGHVYIESKNLGPNDFENFTSLEALYDSMDVFLRDMKPADWKKFKSIYPGDKEVDKYYQKAASFWDDLVKALPPLLEIKTATNETRIVKKYRGTHGGYVIFRPVGLFIIVSAIRFAIDCGLNLKQVLKRMELLSLDINDEPWSTLLWDKTRKRMFPTIAKDRQVVAAKLVAYMIDGDINKVGLTEESLRKQFMKVLSWDEDKNGPLELPIKVI
jgi:DNA sulfur modification protein DndB